MPLEGKIGLDAAILHAVTDTKFQGFKFVKHIEFGQRQRSDSVQTYGISHQHRVKPATTAGSPGGRAKFLTFAAKEFSGLIQQFRGEGTTADTCRVGLNDAYHIRNMPRADPPPGTGIAGDRIG